MGHMMATGPIKVAFLLADYGHDPTETAIPWKVFKKYGWEVDIVTEQAEVPKCDKLMLSGWTQKLLGAPAPAIDAYDALTHSSEWQHPMSWMREDFSLTDFDVVFLPGGHDKGVRQILDSARVHQLLAEYFPLTKKPSKKCCAAICHGVQVLANSTGLSGKSVLQYVTTTALPGLMESAAYQSTRLFLGDYYKTYGAGTANVEDFVKKSLNDPSKQWRSSANPALPFVVEDEGHNYLSGRWPGDAQLLAEKVVRLVHGIHHIQHKAEHRPA
ncbi:hypothetical protein LTR85_005290 [Meristemomyces frigidus]|nr:hypothetical protein LTR85_005290 [Meristemomyces frigidus]